MESITEDNRIAWAVISIGLILELAIGVAGWAAGWMLLKVNLLLELIESANATDIGIGALLGAAAALLICLVVRIVKPLQSSRSLNILSVIAKATWLQIVLICIVAGIAEEILFRGSLQPAVGIWPAAVLFGLLHAYGRLYVFVAIAAGACLGYLYLYSGNLASVAAAHAVYNLAVSSLVKIGLFPIPSNAEEGQAATEPA